MSTLVKRILSAVIVLGVLWFVYNSYGAGGLIVTLNLIVLVGAKEYLSFLKLSGRLKYLVGGLFFVATVLILLIYNLHLNYKLTHVAGILGAYNFILILILRTQKNVEFIFKTMAYSFIGLVVYVSFPANIIIILKNTDGTRHLLNLLMLVFFGDTLAYFTGKSFGGPKLAAAMSPNKTLSGSAGSFLGTIVAGLLIVYYQRVEFSLAFFGFLLLISAVAQAGDLFESTLKRISGIKDSGSIMPGHGGVLDRLDALYFASPVYVLFLIYFNK